ncbi:hypothetical protein [Streptomyces canus]|uniref:hypothetical protein n=1 Tax=Streptomyces canus TaxID=58343 RepID=UPI003F540308
MPEFRTWGREQSRPRTPAILLRSPLRAARPRQWVKNVLVVAAPAAAGRLLAPHALPDSPSSSSPSGPPSAGEPEDVVLRARDRALALIAPTWLAMYGLAVAEWQPTAPSTARHAPQLPCFRGTHTSVFHPEGKIRSWTG